MLASLPQTSSTKLESTTIQRGCSFFDQLFNPCTVKGLMLLNVSWQGSGRVTTLFNCFHFRKKNYKIMCYCSVFSVTLIGKLIALWIMWLKWWSLSSYQEMNGRTNNEFKMGTTAPFRVCQSRSDWLLQVLSLKKKTLFLFEVISIRSVFGN